MVTVCPVLLVSASQVQAVEESLSQCLGGGADTDETYIAAYHAFLQTEAGRLSVPHFTRDLAIAQQFVDQATDTDDYAADSPHDSQQEDWMLLCQHNQRFIM